MKKNIKKICSIFMIFILLICNFTSVIKVKATENEGSTISLQVSGSEFEYNIESGDNTYASNIHFTINGAGTSYDLKSNQVNFTTTGGEIDGFTSKEAYNYDYNNNGESVTFNFYTQWDDVITSLKIYSANDEVLYQGQGPTTTAALITAFSKNDKNIHFDVDNVPYSSNYNIVIEGRKLTESELYMGNFLWSYNENDSVSDDEKIPHGKLEFVKAVYNGTTYDTIQSIYTAGNIYQWEDGIKQSEYTSEDITNKTGIGEAMFPVGTELTIKLIPDIGYQLTNLRLNGQSFEAGSEVGTYTFTITGGNFHLGADFTETANVVNSTSDSVESGSINIDISEENSFEHGTAKLEISDTNPTTKEAFEEEVPEGYEVNDYLDISLYNSIYKGVNNSNSSWDSEISELDNDATITLNLSEDMNGKDVKIIHELHNGSTVTGYEIITPTYDEETNSITFQTDGFSNYALITKKPYVVSDDKGNIIEFYNEDGHQYNFNMISYTEITDEELEELEMTREVYNTLYSGIENATKKYGNILGIYEVILVDENDDELHDGPFKIKIKMTDEMKKYNSFSAIYTDVDNDFATEEPITLNVEGEYLVGTLDHLSVYTIVGNINANPETNDRVLSSIILGSISFISLIGCGLYINRRRFN